MSKGARGALGDLPPQPFVAGIGRLTGSGCLAGPSPRLGYNPSALSRKNSAKVRSRPSNLIGASGVLSWTQASEISSWPASWGSSSPCPLWDRSWEHQWTPAGSPRSPSPPRKTNLLHPRPVAVALSSQPIWERPLLIAVCSREGKPLAAPTRSSPFPKVRKLRQTPEICSRTCIMLGPRCCGAKPNSRAALSAVTCTNL